MSEQKNRGVSLKIVGIAVVFAALAVVSALYVNGMQSGNMVQVADASGESCSATLALAEAIQPLANGQVAAMASATDVTPLQSLAFAGPEGEAMTLGDMSGKTVLVNLWATWCAPCREEMPALDELQAELGGDDFEVVAININGGDDTKPKKFLNDISVSNLGYYRDNTMGAFNTLKKDGLAFGLPVTLLVDDKGCLLSSMNGPAHWSSEDAKTYIRGALKRES